MEGAGRHRNRERVRVRVRDRDREKEKERGRSTVPSAWNICRRAALSEKRPRYIYSR